jgi:hypothetical protein
MMTAICILWIIGLLGAGHAYFYFKKSDERRKAAASRRLCAPEPVPELVHDNQDIDGEWI